MDVRTIHFLHCEMTIEVDRVLRRTSDVKNTPGTTT
jgi:hypothetical protein